MTVERLIPAQRGRGAMGETFIGKANETCLCPDCGHDTAIEDVMEIPHDSLPINIPVSKCWNCGFVWSGAAAEKIVERFVSGERKP